MADVLQAGCRSVVVPFSTGGETEQTRRAELLEERGLTLALPEEELSGERLAKSIEDAMGRGRGAAMPAMNGADSTAGVLASLLQER